MTAIPPEITDLSKYIELQEGRAYLRGLQLSVMKIVDYVEQAGQLSISQLAQQFHLSEEQLLAALLYFHEHKAELAAQAVEDGRKFQQKHPQHTDESGQVRYFTTPPTWTGGYYGLDIALGERNDDRLLTALRAVWNHSGLTGCYLNRERDPYDQVAIKPDASHLQTGQQLFGVAQLRNNERVACGTVVHRFDTSIDWFEFFIPMSALEQVYPVGGFPFDDRTEAHEVWRQPVEAWLAEIAQAVYNVLPFPLALIDFELDAHNIYDLIAIGVPDERRMGYLWPESGKLHYYPRNVMV